MLLVMEWSQVDVERRAAWIHADQAKARRAIPVVLNETAVEVLKRQAGKHAQFVFTYKGRPIGQVNTRAWKCALRRGAGIEDFRWHHLRLTWASWFAQVRRAAERHSGDGRMGNGGDGAAVRASFSGAPGASREALGRVYGRKFGTVAGRGICKHLKFWWPRAHSHATRKPA